MRKALEILPPHFYLSGAFCTIKRFRFSVSLVIFREKRGNNWVYSADSMRGYIPTADDSLMQAHLMFFFSPCELKRGV